MGFESEVDALMREVSTVIRSERGIKRWSVQQLADAAGMSRQTVARFEDDKRLPDVAQLYRIAHALGLTPSQVLRQAEERYTRSIQNVTVIAQLDVDRPSDAAALTDSHDSAASVRPSGVDDETLLARQAIIDAEPGLSEKQKRQLKDEAATVGSVYDLNSGNSKRKRAH